MLSFDQFDEIIEKIKQRGFRSIFIQAPDGLLHSLAKNILSRLDAMEINYVISADPCYGACDIAEQTANMMACDAILHLGHSKFGFSKEFTIPVFYVPLEYKIDLQQIADKICVQITSRNYSTVGLVCSIQHVPSLSLLSKLIENKLVIKTIIPGTGQILGCNASLAQSITDKVDCFICLAGGRFHPKVVPLVTKKPTLGVDPFTERVEWFDDLYLKRFYAKRYAKISKFRAAHNIGLLVSLKSGQYKFDEFKLLQARIKETGRNAYILSSGNINPTHLMNFAFIDGWVIDLCPRLALDDSIRFEKPILTSKELKVVLEDISWSEMITSSYL